MVHLLEKYKGSARKILKIPSNNLIDISTDEGWQNGFRIIGISFDNFTLNRKKTKGGFHSCDFKNSRFIGVQSKAVICELGGYKGDTFLGGGNTWTDCTFSDVSFPTENSSLNIFRRCSFNNAYMLKFKPYQTLFEDCIFEKLHFESLRTDSTINSTSYLPQMYEKDEQGLLILKNLSFKNCIFNNPHFEKCYFKGVEFVNCTFNAPFIEYCSFDGIIGEPPEWVKAQENCEPLYKSFLELKTSMESLPNTGILYGIFQDEISKGVVNPWDILVALDCYCSSNSIPDDEKKIYRRICKYMEQHSV